MKFHTLKRGSGPFSSGTRVNIVSNNRQDKTYTVEITHIEPTKENGVDYEDLVFDIDYDEVVEHRSQINDIPLANRKSRRALINQLMQK